MKSTENGKTLNSLRAQLIILEHHAEKIREAIADLKTPEPQGIETDIIYERSLHIISGSRSIQDQLQDQSTEAHS